MIRKLFLLSAILVITFMIGCNVPQQERKIEDCKEKEDFDLFLQKFYKDSSFQLSRITFPLDGANFGSDYNPLQDEENENFKWRKEDWEIQSTFNYNELNMIREINKKDSVVFERIYIENSGFDIDKQFKRLTDCKWYLVYYSYHNL